MRISFDIRKSGIKPMFAARGGCFSSYVCTNIYTYVPSKATFQIQQTRTQPTSTFFFFIIFREKTIKIETKIKNCICEFQLDVGRPGACVLGAHLASDEIAFSHLQYKLQPIVGNFFNGCQFLILLVHMHLHTKGYIHAYFHS